MNTATHRSQRGGATLGLSLMLALLTLLGAGFAHRGLVFEQRSAVNQYRATQAIEAAGAGLEWAVALLNNPAPVDEQCRPTVQANATSFAQRLSAQASAGQPLHAACLLAEGAWTCHCPATGEAQLVRRDAPNFAVSLKAGDRPGQTLVEARVCSAQAACTGTDRAAVQARVQTLVARLPGLVAGPEAALTVHGHTDLRGADAGLHHRHETGITLHAGGSTQLGAARLHTTPGAPPLASVADGDDGLAALSSGRFFTAAFGMGSDHWRDQPGTARIACHEACDEALAAALARGHRLIWLNGGLHLAQPALLGTPQRPVLLVVDGPVALQAPFAVHGLVYTRHPTWTATAGAQVHGALIAEGDFTPQGSFDIHHHATTLADLHAGTGTFARVPGSWRDF